MNDLKKRKSDKTEKHFLEMFKMCSLCVLEGTFDVFPSTLVLSQNTVQSQIS